MFFVFLNTKFNYNIMTNKICKPRYKLEYDKMMIYIK